MSGRFREEEHPVQPVSVLLTHGQSERSTNGTSIQTPHLASSRPYASKSDHATPSSTRRDSKQNNSASKNRNNRNASLETNDLKGRGFGKAHIRSLQPISKPQSVFKEEADEEEMETSRSHEEPMEMETAIPPLYENIDEDDADNPQLCSEYVNDIYKYMRELEVGSRADSRTNRNGAPPPSFRSSTRFRRLT